MYVKAISITRGLGDLKDFTPEQLLGHNARISNQSNQKNTSTMPKLLKRCMTKAEWSVFDQVYLGVEIGTSRGISPQILRHWSFDFQEFSQRYAAIDETGIEIYAARRQDLKNRQNSIDDLPQAIKDEWERRQLENWKHAFEHYMWALKNEIAKECARFVLPIGTKTALHMSGSARNWIHYLTLRTKLETQKEHRDIVEEVKKIFVEHFPDLSSALNWT